MEFLVWFYAKLALGVLLSGSALAAISYLALKGRGQAYLPFVVVLLVGVWLLTGGKIKAGSIEAQAEDFSKVAQAMGDISKGSSLTDIDELTQLNERGVAVWWKLLQYRIEIRALLRQICFSSGCELKSADVGLQKLIEELSKRNVIDPALTDTLDKIRLHTYYAEWRAGEAPDAEAVKYVLNVAPAALTQLQQFVVVK